MGGQYIVPSTPSPDGDGILPNVQCPLPIRGQPQRGAQHSLTGIGVPPRAIGLEPQETTSELHRTSAQHLLTGIGAPPRHWSRSTENILQNCNNQRPTFAYGNQSATARHWSRTTGNHLQTATTSAHRGPQPLPSLGTRTPGPSPALFKLTLPRVLTPPAIPGTQAAEKASPYSCPLAAADLARFRISYTSTAMPTAHNIRRGSPAPFPPPRLALLEMSCHNTTG